MQIHKTHILIKENKFTGMGGQTIEPFMVFECRIPGTNLAQSGKTIYFREFMSGFGTKALEFITEERFKELEIKTEEFFKAL